MSKKEKDIFAKLNRILKKDEDKKKRKLMKLKNG